MYDSYESVWHTHTHTHTTYIHTHTHTYIHTHNIHTQTHHINGRFLTCHTEPHSEVEEEGEAKDVLCYAGTVEVKLLFGFFGHISHELLVVQFLELGNAMCQQRFISFVCINEVLLHPFFKPLLHLLFIALGHRQKKKEKDLESKSCVCVCVCVCMCVCVCICVMYVYEL